MNRRSDRQRRPALALPSVAKRSSARASVNGRMRSRDPPDSQMRSSPIVGRAAESEPCTCISRVACLLVQSGLAGSP